jgi:hypothetical protein
MNALVVTLPFPDNVSLSELTPPVVLFLCILLATKRPVYTSKVTTKRHCTVVSFKKQYFFQKESRADSRRET